MMIYDDALKRSSSSYLGIDGKIYENKSIVS